jgi:zinc transporter 1/2/3
VFYSVCVHQLFEALAVGIRILRARSDRMIHIVFLEVMFALSCPIGVGIGMAIRTSINVESFAVASGVVSSFSAGILIYVGTIHLLVDEVRRASSDRLGMTLVYVGVVLGAALMTVLAIWA